MSTVSVYSEEPKSQPDWARLIPGEMPQIRPQKRKPPRPAQFGVRKKGVATRHAREDSQPSFASLVVPKPFSTRTALKWIRSMAADFALVALGWLLMGACLVPLRTEFPQVWSFKYSAGAPMSLLGVAILHAALITLIGYTEGLHRQDIGRAAQGWILGKAVLLATAVLCLGYTLQGATWVTAGLFGIVGGLNFGMLWAWRRWNHVEEAEKLTDKTNVLIIGAGGVGQRVAEQVRLHASTGRTICGFLDDQRPLGGGVIGRTGDLARIARKEFVDEVILAAPRKTELTRWVVEEACRLRLDVEVVPDLFGFNPAEPAMERVGGVPMICLHEERLPIAGLVLKRLIDVTGAMAALAVLAPFLAVIALLIKLDSAGPVLYCALRAGRKGRLFRCFKFRTMVSDADRLKNGLREGNERSGPFFKMADDPRITRVGRYLRRYSLDELPQLWNVAKGEMSLVGPRPHPLDDVAGYEIEHLARLDVTPGITGLWQVKARRDPSFERGVELDREYIRTWSLAADIRILLMTFRAVVCGSGQ
ncbi:MAG TPA: sugar transferase [Candidatus Sulfotelmatobacter sp.]|nr:sugar transferase [Candidatus Sulfotelmatobacter sp.]